MMDFAYYLLKMGICSGIFYLYYVLALRNKSFHQWNRFYLLTAVVLSMVVPVIQVTIYHQQADGGDKGIQLLNVVQSASNYLDEAATVSQHSASSGGWMLLAYVTVSIALLFMLVRSIVRICSIIARHRVTQLGDIHFINSRVPGTPFSFFHFIFWNDDIDLQSETGQQIFQHERIHVKEKHSFDKLFMEIVLVVFWCNPFFWFIRKELKIIHEFIADKKAVGEHGSAALAAMVLQSAYPAQFHNMLNHFFHTSIKRRITMLGKIQHPRLTYVSRIISLPVIAITIMAFAIRAKNIQRPVPLEKDYTIVIDPGHGMKDGRYNGARDGDVYEDDIVLAIAQKIKADNKNEHLKIVLTRSAAGIVDLPSRVNVAKENNADLFISLHVNATDPNTHNAGKREKGFEIYVANRNASYQMQSELLGSALQQELSSVYATFPFLLKGNTGIFVLDKNVCPSIMIECGYVTDPDDKKFITNEGNQEIIAQKILQGIERYVASK